jgi:hypothetical protein
MMGSCAIPSTHKNENQESKTAESADRYDQCKEHKE